MESKVKSLKNVVAMYDRLEVSNRLSEDKRPAMNEARSSYGFSKTQLKDKQDELEEINKFMNTRAYGKIICSGTIYPGTKISIGALKMNVSENIMNASLYLKDGSIYKGQVY